MTRVNTHKKDDNGIEIYTGDRITIFNKKWGDYEWATVKMLQGEPWVYSGDIAEDSLSGYVDNPRYVVRVMKENAE